LRGVLLVEPGESDRERSEKKSSALFFKKEEENRRERKSVNRFAASAMKPEVAKKGSRTSADDGRLKSFTKPRGVRGRGWKRHP